MSGFRSLHREDVTETALWNVRTTTLLTTKSGKSATAWRIWTAGADGLVRSFVAQEASVDSKDASALRLTCSHRLGESSSIGCTRVSTVRNYVGDDDSAGDLVVASLDLTGIVRLWNFAEDMDNDVVCNKSYEEPKNMKPLAEFHADNATGSALELCSPRWFGVGDVVAAIACLDGTISIVATGISTPKATREARPAGTLLDSLGSQGSAIPLSLAWQRPTKSSDCLLAVGRQDGVIDILTAETGKKQNQHRLSQGKSPIRSVCYTDDGKLLIAGSDSGFLSVWDVSRQIPTLVHHVLHAHPSWIMGIAALDDSRRFVTAGAERQLHVWDVGQISQPVHTFQTDGPVWSLQRGPRGISRLATSGENGNLQVFSVED